MYILSYSDCFSPVVYFTPINDSYLMSEYLTLAQGMYYKDQYHTQRFYRNYTMGSSYGSDDVIGGSGVIGGSVDVLKTSSAVKMMTSSFVFSYLSFIIRQPPIYAKKALAA